MSFFPIRCKIYLFLETDLTLPVYFKRFASLQVHQSAKHNFMLSLYSVFYLFVLLFLLQVITQVFQFCKKSSIYILIFPF